MGLGKQVAQIMEAQFDDQMGGRWEGALHAHLIRNAET